jgi:hypothetical protein
MRRDAIQEEAIVRDDDRAAREIHQAARNVRGSHRVTKLAEFLNPDVNWPARAPDMAAIDYLETERAGAGAGAEAAYEAGAEAGATADDAAPSSLTRRSWRSERGLLQNGRRAMQPKKESDG